jgi:ParB-like chromosome segregation protein Spo0J
MPTETPQERLAEQRKRLGVPKDLKGPQGRERQPVSNVVWLPRDQIKANDYNPNHVAPPEMRLLKISLLTDGWTQPVVVRPADGEKMTWSAKIDEPIEIAIEGITEWELVDGFHRWLASEDKRIQKMTQGELPCVAILPDSPEHQMASTIRHNRARGTHVVLKMADIAVSMDDAGMPHETIRQLLQMEDEELERLLVHGNMKERGAKEGFNKGWTPG